MIQVDRLNSEVVNSPHKILLLLKLIIIRIGFKTLIFFAKISKILQANKFFAGWLDVFNIHWALREKILILTIDAWKASIKMFRNFAVSNDPNVLRQAVI